MRKFSVLLVLLLITAVPAMADCVVCGQFPGTTKSECVEVDSYGAAWCRNIVRGGGCASSGIGDCAGADGPPECYNRPDYPGCKAYSVFNLEFEIDAVEIETTPAVAAMMTSNASGAAL